jgi:hypothetical protein
MPYVLFIDESGDHNLKNIDSEFPIFCLAGCVFERGYYREIVRPKVDNFKKQFWGRNDVILVSHKIRKHQGDFAFLDNKEKRDCFYGAINDLINDLIFNIIAIVILKQRHLDQYGIVAINPYDLSLEFIMERFSMMMRSKNKKEDGYMIAESRGKNEDKLLKDEYMRLKTIGTKYLNPINITSFWMEKKDENIAGLQIADLVAYPIATKIYRPTDTNPAFNVLQHKILSSSKSKGDTILGYGLKIFPQPSLEHYLLFGVKKGNEP